MPIRQLPDVEHIYQRLTKDGAPVNYEARIRRKNFPKVSAVFRTLEEAQAFVVATTKDQDQSAISGLPLAHRVTVGDVIDEAIGEIDTGRRDTKGASTERLRLNAFRRDFQRLCETPLADATEDVFDDWMADRLEEVKPNTVLRELRLLRPLFATAARRYELSRSPVQFIKPPRMVDDRIRRIGPDEEALIFAELARAQDPMVPLAARFALETGCRRSEQLRLEWRDYDAKAGTIWLPDAKNGRGRYILLTSAAHRILEAMPDRPDAGKIFGITGNKLRKAFEYARSRASIRAVRLGHTHLAKSRTLRWHDFRHEAISRCFDDGWTSEQVMDFSGHVDIKSLLRYRHSDVDLSVARLRALEKSREAASSDQHADSNGAPGLRFAV